jgi:hypothetical protein
MRRHHPRNGSPKRLPEYPGTQARPSGSAGWRTLRGELLEDFGYLPAFDEDPEEIPRGQARRIHGQSGYGTVRNPTEPASSSQTVAPAATGTVRTVGLTLRAYQSLATATPSSAPLVYAVSAK